LKNFARDYLININNPISRIYKANSNLNIYGTGASLYHKFASNKTINIALYSHDTMGLGHIRRNLLIAGSISNSSIKANILVISGAREAAAFHIPKNVDFLTLPSYYKNHKSEYIPKNFNIDLESLKSIRSHSIKAALRYFNPDLFIVDKVPRGVLCELDSTLKTLKKMGNTKIILGLRDILDRPEDVNTEWKREKNIKYINKYYDSVWIYGDPYIYDLTKEYKISHKLRIDVVYTGYLVLKNLNETYKERRRINQKLNFPKGRLILCLVGGGQDGEKIVETFSKVNFRKDTYGVVLTGPFMPIEIVNKLKKCSESNSRLFIYNFVPDPMILIERAESVISMGGYNTICELLSLNKRALIIPRINPRKEQLIRAKRMTELMLVEMMHPDDMNPISIENWICGSKKNSKISKNINLNGIKNVSNIIKEMFTDKNIKLTGS